MLITIVTVFLVSLSEASTWPPRTKPIFPSPQVALPTPPPDVEPALNSPWARQAVTFGERDQSVCGYIDFNPLLPVACYENEYCSYYSNAFVCCSTSTTYSSTSGTQHFGPFTSGVNCTNYLPTDCYNYNSTAACTGECESTAAYCNDSAYPFCAAITGPNNYITSSPPPMATAAYCDTRAYTSSVAAYWSETLSGVSSPASSSAGSGGIPANPATTTGPTSAFSFSQGTVSGSVLTEESVGGGTGTGEEGQATVTVTASSVASCSGASMGMYWGLSMLACTAYLIFIG